MVDNTSGENNKGKGCGRAYGIARCYKNSKIIILTWNGHILYLIDCLKHFDFSQIVARSARAFEESLLLVDTTRGAQAKH